MKPLPLTLLSFFAASYCQGGVSGTAAAVTMNDLSAFSCAVPSGYDMPGKKKKASLSIPPWVMKLSGSRVRVQGFMVPFDVAEDGVKSFSLVKNIMMCCFGLAPQLNEIIYCDMSLGQKAKFYINVPIDVEGVITVGEIRDNGYLIGIYHIKVDSVVRSKNPDPSLMRYGPRPSPFSGSAPRWMPQGWSGAPAR